MTLDIRATSSSPQWTRPMVRAGASSLVIGCGLVTVMVYPFMPGRYDALAVGLSTVVQVFGLVGPLLVPPAVLWLLMPRRSRLFATLCLAAGTIVVVAMAAAAASSVGLSLGVLVLAIGAVVFARLVARLRRPAKADGTSGRALALQRLARSGESAKRSDGLSNPVRRLLTVGPTIGRCRSHRSSCVSAARCSRSYGAPAWVARIGRCGARGYLLRSSSVFVGLLQPSPVFFGLPLISVCIPPA